MALTGFATMYAGSVGINPGDILQPNGTVTVGLLGNSGTKSGSGITNSSLTTPSVDGLTGVGTAQGNYYTQTYGLDSGLVTPVLPQTSTSFHSTTCTQTAATGNCQQTIMPDWSSDLRPSRR